MNAEIDDHINGSSLGWWFDETICMYICITRDKKVNLS